MASDDQVIDFAAMGLPASFGGAATKPAKVPAPKTKSDKSTKKRKIDSHNRQEHSKRSTQHAATGANGIQATRGPKEASVETSGHGSDNDTAEAAVQAQDSTATTPAASTSSSATTYWDAFVMPSMTGDAWAHLS
ncbi:uncharacterized protein L969DRAFT_292811 [Mixia osmundae IAM 14324]|uniref:Uncharacterized protein n=1 Tax=Mixia osmundae (strain CBS 9802 / IAM 14324 / JCM 22182 / KY 12970) TaxID=764103 RepID=G7DXJ2_MIXOS|nr:uncharacterized protein L969DRAFT_292811 [Mixia osmundae IAM 14324]KEI41204.1 hypothetical protein L969DRAFT_292811 [Mixia osmundae IAM 14324]GAA95302.1 hypothetical protein E5Q_01959 [Mixia osmundae IAM 14324]